MEKLINTMAHFLVDNPRAYRIFRAIGKSVLFLSTVLLVISIVLMILSYLGFSQINFYSTELFFTAQFSLLILFCWKAGKYMFNLKYK